MRENIFNKDFYHIEGDKIELCLINTYEEKDGALPFYWWDIIQKSNNVAVGKIYLTCDYDNVASYKTIEKLGANLIEEVLPPKDYIFYYHGIEIHRIYELEIS